MQLSHIALIAVKGLMPGIISELKEALKVDSDATIYRYVSDNDDNLTKAAALKVIREHTGLKDADILVEEPIKTTTQN